VGTQVNKAPLFAVDSETSPTLETRAGNEPPLKRFKALFDESERPADDPEVMFASIAQQTQSYTQSGSRVTGFGAQSGAALELTPVPEEEEEESGLTDVFDAPESRKRKAGQQRDGDVEMDEYVMFDCFNLC
jgi:hypothetical protein